MALPALAWELLVREVSDSAARWSFTTSVSSIIDLCAIAAVLRQRKGEIYQHTHTDLITINCCHYQNMIDSVDALAGKY